MRDRIAHLGPSLGYTQAACGADILFLEAMQDAGMQTQIVLPFRRRNSSLPALASPAKNGHGVSSASWRGRREVVLATEEGFLGDDVLFEHAANLIQGMAFLRARELSAHPLMLTVHRARHTRTCRRHRGNRPKLGARRAAGSTTSISPRCVAIASGRGVRIRGRRIRSFRAVTKAQTLLFADICGYTRMPEQYTPDFAEMFLGNCKAILGSLEHPPPT